MSTNPTTAEYAHDSPSKLAISYLINTSKHTTTRKARPTTQTALKHPRETYLPRSTTPSPPLQQPRSLEYINPSHTPNPHHWRASGDSRTTSPTRAPSTSRRRVITNLQQKRVTLATRAWSTDFAKRGCCKRMRCFEHVEKTALSEMVRRTMVMRQKDRRQLLASWLCDGVFLYRGRKVCSAFLVAAFGFSRDLQRSVKLGLLDRGR